MMRFPEQFRLTDVGAWSSREGDQQGAFLIPKNKARGRALRCIADDGWNLSSPWEHVSVSLVKFPKKCPSWDEMCLVKDLFWEDEDTVCQFHPPKSEYVNMHEGCLHLWRYKTEGMVTPEGWRV